MPPYAETFWFPMYHSEDYWRRPYPETDVWGVQVLDMDVWSGDGYGAFVAPSEGLDAAFGIVNVGPSLLDSAQSEWACVESAPPSPLGSLNLPSTHSLPSLSKPAQTGCAQDSDDGISGAGRFDEEGASGSSSTGRRGAFRRGPHPGPGGSRAGLSVFATLKSGVAVEAVSRSEAGRHVCHLPHPSGPRSRTCERRFSRPEHFRRHQKTVHGGGRNHSCQVPSCGRTFSRSDNLRSHYWTHVARGGRSGSNVKMALEELSGILGATEDGLVRWLQQRLRDEKAKQATSLHGRRR